MVANMANLVESPSAQSASKVVIVGAGPAGATLALLLAQRGVAVTLVERRRDFSREFRGEILMPSGIEALEQMGLADVLTAIPACVQRHGAFHLNGRELFSLELAPEPFAGRLPIAISQPAFLEAVVQAAGQSAHFKFERGVALRSLMRQGERVSGVLIREASGDVAGERALAADLVIGADGRNSTVRRQLGLAARSMSPPMDIVWCKLPCPNPWQGLRAYAGRGHLLVAYRTWDDRLQLGWVILKGRFGALRSRGVDAWIDEMANHASADLAGHLRRNKRSRSAQRPFLLDSVSDRVDRWSLPGALLIGDAAHAMSPVAGQGINIALRDAIVAANHLVPVLSQPFDPARLADALARIEAERLPEVARVQRLQALPPKVMLSRAWWGEPVRRAASHALRRPAVRGRMAASASGFLFGVTDVRLQV